MSLCSEKEPVELNVIQEERGSEVEVITQNTERLRYPVYYKGLTQTMKNTTNYEWAIESFVNTIIAMRALRTDKFLIEPFEDSKVYLELELKEKRIESKPVFQQPSQDSLITPTKTNTATTPNISSNISVLHSNVENTAESFYKSPLWKFPMEKGTGVHNKYKDTLPLTPKYTTPFSNEKTTAPGLSNSSWPYKDNFANSNFSITPSSSEQSVNLSPTNKTTTTKSGSSGKYLTLYLINFTADNSPSWITMKATTVNACGKEICSKSTQETNSRKYSRIGFDHYLDLNDIQAEDAVDDTVTIKCEIVYYHNTRIQQISNIQYVPQDTADTINKIIDASGLKEPDFIFRCEGKDIRLHKGALIAQSAEMASVFEDQSLEKMVGVKNIEADYETMLEMVRFIYTGRVKNLNELAPKLLCVAEKYKLKSLKTLCEKNLYDNLTVENAAETLLLADEYKAEDLEREVLFFINKNVHPVINTDGYKNIESTSTVPSKILRMMASSKC